MSYIRKNDTAKRNNFNCSNLIPRTEFKFPFSHTRFFFSLSRSGSIQPGYESFDIPQAMFFFFFFLSGRRLIYKDKTLEIISFLLFDLKKYTNVVLLAVILIQPSNSLINFSKLMESFFWILIILC